MLNCVLLGIGKVAEVNLWIMKWEIAIMNTYTEYHMHRNASDMKDDVNLDFVFIIPV